MWQYKKWETRERTPYEIYSPPGFEFDVRNNKCDDANDLTDELYKSSY